MSACWLVTLLAAAAPSDLPEYPGAALVRIGGDLALSGGLYRLGYFVTEDSVAAVSDYFLATWDGQGLPATADGDFTAEAVVSAFRTREGLQLGVVLVALDRGTLGISAVRDLWAAASAPERESAGLLGMDVASAARSVSEELSAEGFTVLREGRRGRAVVLQHGRGDERQLSVIAPAGEGAAVLQSAAGRDGETEEGSR